MSVRVPALRSGAMAKLRQNAIRIAPTENQVLGAPKLTFDPGNPLHRKLPKNTEASPIQPPAQTRRAEGRLKVS